MKLFSKGWLATRLYDERNVEVANDEGACMSGAGELLMLRGVRIVAGVDSAEMSVILTQLKTLVKNWALDLKAECLMFRQTLLAKSKNVGGLQVCAKCWRGWYQWKSSAESVESQR